MQINGIYQVFIEFYLFLAIHVAEKSTATPDKPTNVYT